MSTGAAPTQRGSATPAPLSAAERAQVDRVVRRLHGELTAFLAGLPATAGNASGMARFLGIDRTTCQRAVFVASRPYSGLEVVERLPGIRALRSIEGAARERVAAVDASLVEALGAAVTQYQEVVSSVGGSLTRLTKRIVAEAAPPDADSAAVRAPRRRLFEAAREITGRSSDCWVAVYVYRPAPDGSGSIEVLRANGLVGHSARADAVPLVVHNFSSVVGDEPSAEGRFASLEAGAEGGGTLVLEDFTSSPSPLVTARQPGEFLVQTVDAAAGSDGRTVDLMLATRTAVEDLTERKPSIEEVWGLVNFPCRHLLLDVYLHPDLARRSVPAVDTHLWGPDFATQVGNRWQTRFNETPPLQLLGTGVREGAPRAYPRLPELTGQLFERGGIDPASYVGYRCDVSYPIWRAGYCITFDFSEPEG